MAQVRSVRHAVRALQLADLAQQDPDPSQLLCAPPTLPGQQPTIACVLVDLTNYDYSDLHHDQFGMDDWQNTRECLTDDLSGPRNCISPAIVDAAYGPRDSFDPYGSRSDQYQESE